MKDLHNLIVEKCTEFAEEMFTRTVDSVRELIVREARIDLPKTPAHEAVLTYSSGGRCVLTLPSGETHIRKRRRDAFRWAKQNGYSVRT